MSAAWTDDAEQQARGVDGDVALAALDPLGRVVAARPPLGMARPFVP
jgi:hypothetical protein